MEQLMLSFQKPEKSLVDKIQFLLTQKKYHWRLLIIDDFASQPLKTYPQGGSRLNKTDLIVDILSKRFDLQPKSLPSSSDSIELCYRPEPETVSFSIERAETMHEAINKLKQTCYDIVLLDRNKTNSSAPEYPVYVAISPHSVYFKVHIAEGDLHGHFDLFTIPLDKGMITDSNFTEMLRKAYITQISSSRSENEIMKFLYRHLEQDSEEKQEPGKSDMEKKYITYSTLDVFNRERENTNYYLLRKLILDFLYDLDHTSVFSLSPYSNALLSKLCENHLFNAILRKARYYYYRQLKEDKNMQQLVTPTFLQKAKDWNTTIRNPHAESSCR